MTKRLTEEEFFALPEAERTRLLDLEFKDYIFRDVCERAKTMQPVPRRKATVGFRVGPHVIHFRKHGRWWKWWIYCDGWSEPRRAGRHETCLESVQGAIDAYVDMFCGRRRSE